MKLRFIILITLLFSFCASFSQVKIFIWQEIDPAWKNRSIDYWENVKGYGKHVPAEMTKLIKEYYSQAAKKLELSLREKMLTSSLPGTPVFTNNPGADYLTDQDYFMDIQCMILEVSDKYPNFRTRKLKIKPSIKYNTTLYNSKGEIVAQREFVDEIDFKSKIQAQVRGMSEHRRDVETIQLSYFESFAGSLPDQIINELSEKVSSQKNQNIESDPDKFKQVIGLVFDKRKLQYPEDYKNVLFEQQPSSGTITSETFPRKQTENANTAIADKLNAIADESKYYALVIGVNDYIDPSLNDLSEPLNDARRLYNTLVSKYTFSEKNMTFLVNPTRDQLIKSFDKLAKDITKDDNLLIFYAGHGLWDKQLKKGFWMPANASSRNRTNWFSNSDLRDYIGGIRARHILLISDACFSGGIFKTREVFNSTTPATLELYKIPSRKAMTSGAMTTVPDKSVFIDFLIKRLDENSNYFLSSEQLYASFKIAVINNSPTRQIPQFGEIRETGDEGGDFLFIRKNN